MATIAQAAADALAAADCPGGSTEIDRLALHILARIEPLEEAHDVADGDRLDAVMAQRIAAGVLGSGADSTAETIDEMVRVFGSMARREAFSRSPGAYLVAAAKRRGWVPST